MAWRPHGHATVDATAPSAFGVCDRCGFLHNLDALSWQYDWRGPRLQNLRVLICTSCKDRPQDQLRPKPLPPDPVPRFNPRPEQYATEDVGISAAEAAEPPDFGPPILSG